MTSKMIRLNKSEIVEIKVKCKEINKELVNLEKETIKESELIHKIIELALKSIKVNKTGEMEL